ncbi:SRPBCC family protein [Henriciella litoralis]|uniref:SRPBCC family protein n=1 Tax=Henriciella litoralis TaxID=568102 RepID=UPI000A034CC0|nr:SRPBCC family protein [Henriciella litoralis]
MAKEPKKLEEVGEAYLADASKVHLVSHDFPFAPEVLWAALLDGDTWTKWLPITKVEWTSPKPYKVGTTRTVWIGSQIVEEVFFAWDEGSRMAFRFDRTTLPLNAGVEDYQVHATETGCRLDWRFRARAPFLLGPLISAQMKSGIRKGLPKLEAYIRDNPAKYGLS